MKLSDLKIIVTGGAQGMGAHFALRLVEAGAQVAIGDVNEAGLAATKEAAKGPGALHAKKLNVADEAEVVAEILNSNGAQQRPYKSQRGDHYGAVEEPRECRLGQESGKVSVVKMVRDIVGTPVKWRGQQRPD